jgi:type IV fimbrial biogenesis protein FimT
MSIKRRAAGFSLLELLITMAIAAILLTIGIPSFTYVTNSNRTTSEVNGLLGDLQFARAEAIKEGVYVTACVSTNGSSCNGVGSTNWNDGWIVFSDPGNLGAGGPNNETILKIQNTFTSTDILTASNAVSAITFNREGYATGIANGTLITLHAAAPSNSAYTRCLSITFIGLMTTERYGVTDPSTGKECL